MHDSAISRIGKEIYAGLFTISLATLTFEILLTRIFSVTLWYHFAFMAISVAMFGMTAGALIVYLRPASFTRDRAPARLVLASLLFAVSIVACFMVYLAIPLGPKGRLTEEVGLAVVYIVISVPFVFSGISICIALTKFPEQVGRLYAADLGGAAIGCIALKLILDRTDGPTAVLVVATLAGVGALLFSFGRVSRGLRIASWAVTLVLLSAAGTHAVRVRSGDPLIRLQWIKGKKEPPLLYERWNSFSRITIEKDPDELKRPAGWGFSEAMGPQPPVEQFILRIDGTASTTLTRFDGKLSKLQFLKYDIVNLAHHFRPGSSALVIGVGGGRDVLSALVFGHRAVVGVELNEAILDATNRTYEAFTGYLDRNPKVTLVNDEARSYAARSRDRFDIVQVSLIDTWAATAAGAFTLAENSLYTLEAWETFLGHLSENGILTFSRWYFRDNPGEMYRVTSLAAAALRRLGVTNPRDHILIARKMVGAGGPDGPDGVGTILVGRSPFSKADLETFADVVEQLRFDPVLTPGYTIDRVFSDLASVEDLASVTDRFPIDISPPTDDKPFFFHMLRLGDVFDYSPSLRYETSTSLTFNIKAVYLLGVLILVVVVLTLAGILLPLSLAIGRRGLSGAGLLGAYFGSIGFGYILIEISQLQRLIVFLGHPTYGLSVVLLSLLLSSGLGSLTVRPLEPGGLMESLRRRFALLLLALAAFGLLTPWVARAFAGADTPIRVLIAVSILFPLGFCMGMPFPLGMQAANSRSEALTPWMWGINGATSVCGSVLAAAASLTWGISTTFWIGAAFYAVALAASLGIARYKPSK